MISYGSPGIYSTNYASWVNSDGVLGSGIHYDVNSGSYGACSPDTKLSDIDNVYTTGKSGEIYGLRVVSIYSYG